MKFTEYSVFLYDDYRKRFENISNFHLSKKRALNWINLDDDFKRKYEKGLIEIRSKKSNSDNFVEYQQKEIIKNILKAQND